MILDNIVPNYMLVIWYHQSMMDLDCAYKFNKVQLFGIMFYIRD